MVGSLRVPSVDAFCTSSSTKIMSNQVYYAVARVGADSIALYVESPDFDSAYDVAEKRIARSYKGPFTVQALQLIDAAKRSTQLVDWEHST